jgi:creatinine amidohydrolase/Fe(II)-dependent formamide hydrolase-like protein
VRLRLADVLAAVGLRIEPADLAGLEADVAALTAFGDEPAREREDVRLDDLVAEAVRRGATEAFLEVRADNEGAQRLYREEGGELTHGGGIETLAILAYDPALVKVERAGEPTRPDGALEMDAMRRSHEVYGFITDVSELADDGWYGNPGWATPDRAATFTKVVADGVLELLGDVLNARDIRRMQLERE